MTQKNKALFSLKNQVDTEPFFDLSNYFKINSAACLKINKVGI